MASRHQHRGCGRNRWRATAALALAFTSLLTIVAKQEAQAQTFNVIHSFTNGPDGAIPYAGLTMDAAGNLYGTAFSGGTGHVGTVFKLSRGNGGWIFSSLYNFAGGNDGAGPYSGLILRDGSVYGTTVYGGGTGCGGLGCGTVFRLEPPTSICKNTSCSWIETVLHSFQGALGDAASPYGDLVFDQAGDLYGTTIGGGNENGGTVFELTPSSGGQWTESIVYNFTNTSPYSGVTFDNDGNIYLTCLYYADYFGDYYYDGAVFDLVTSGGGLQEQILHSFQGATDGGHPIGGLIFDRSGNLYGATTSGGDGGGGTVFELIASNGGWTYNKLYDFVGQSSPEGGPHDNLIMDNTGNLYGTTYQDGAYGFGSVFKLTNSNGRWTYTSLHDFTGGSDGANPFSRLVLDANGNLYGTASGRGASIYGVVFEITP